MLKHQEVLNFVLWFEEWTERWLKQFVYHPFVTLLSSSFQELQPQSEVWRLGCDVWHPNFRRWRFYGSTKKKRKHNRFKVLFTTQVEPLGRIRSILFVNDSLIFPSSNAIEKDLSESQDVNCQWNHCSPILKLRAKHGEAVPIHKYYCLKLT